jgi:catecholate siderophore receptor
MHPRNRIQQAILKAAFHYSLPAGIALLATVSAFAEADLTPSYLPEQEEIAQLDKFLVSERRSGQTYAIQRSFTATRTDTSIINVPQAVTVITRELIDDQGMRSIGDLTRYVPGAGIAQGEGNRDTPVLRGNSTTADFFIDGVRDDVQYYRDLYNVDRVEVLKGPNAMIFGRGGSGGVINRVIKQASSVPTGDLTLQAGSWDQYRATLDFGRPIQRSAAFRLTSLYENSGSYRNGVTLRRYGINPTFTWAPAPRTRLRFGAEYFHDERVADRGVPSFHGRPVDVPAQTFFGDPAQSTATVTVRSVFATLEHHFANGTSLRNNARFSGHARFYQNVFPGAVNSAGDRVAITAYNNATERDNFVNQTDFVLPFDTGMMQHQMLMGVELARQSTDNRRLTGFFTSISPVTTSVTVPLSSPRTNLPLDFRANATDASNSGIARTRAAYIQDQITLLPRLMAIIGVRMEYFTMDFLNRRTLTPIASSNRLYSPRAGLIYQPAEGLSLYTSYGTTYLPRAGEQLSSLTLSNRSLDPENYRNYELGLKWNLRPDLAATVAAYRLDRRNVAIPDPLDPTRSLLVDGQRTEGLELGLSGRLGRRWSVAGGYAYQDGRIKTTQSSTVVAGSRLAQLPRHTLSLWNRCDLDPHWGLGLGIIYRDNIFASTDNTVTLPAFVRFDAAVFWRQSDRLRAQINIENILNHGYYASANSNNNITPGAPLTLRLSMTTAF